MPLPEAFKIVIVALLALAVFIGSGLVVTRAVASALLGYRSAAALGRLRDFGAVEFQPDRLKWTLDEAALRRLISAPASPCCRCWREWRQWPLYCYLRC